MSDMRIKRVVIVGGGTAGWMTAAVFSRAMGESLDVHVVESDAIGTVGVGESTIPQIRNVNHFLGIDEDAMLRATSGTFKLAIQYNDWVRQGHSYLHAFGDVGLPMGPLPFQQYWLRRRAESGADDLATYSRAPQKPAAWPGSRRSAAAPWRASSTLSSSMPRCMAACCALTPNGGE
jgi:tryptophan halogenase